MPNCKLESVKLLKRLSKIEEDDLKMSKKN
jgi:hypothetical protein